MRIERRPIPGKETRLPSLLPFRSFPTLGVIKGGSGGGFYFLALARSLARSHGTVVLGGQSGGRGRRGGSRGPFVSTFNVIYSLAACLPACLCLPAMLAGPQGCFSGHRFDVSDLSATSDRVKLGSKSCMRVDCKCREREREVQLLKKCPR